MIKLDALHKYFNKGKSNEIHVINDVSLDFPDHGMVAIFGRSGCGKTTLLNVIGGLDKVQSGKVYLGSAEMKPGRDELRNQYIGYIFQNYCLNGNDTCYENVATSLRLSGMEDEEEISKRVHAALAAVGMDTFYKRVPNSLSGGQQQRIAIARAIVKNPQIILADEPTGNLDETNTIVIMDILKQLSKTRLVLLLTHEENLVDYYCDSVIELSDGRVVNVRNNSESNGYVAKDKNTIYLGEYDRKVFDNEAVHMSYYGDLPETPVKVRMINRNGALYLKVETPGVHVLDETSEIHLEKGKFEEQCKAAEEGEKIDLSDLTDFTGKNYGRLFGFRDGIKSGLSMITASSSKKKKTAKRLRRVMACFAVALVFVVARFGVGIKEYREAKENCITDLISVDVGSFENPEKKLQLLFDSMNKQENGIRRVIADSTNILKYQSSMVEITYVSGAFETYSKGMMSMLSSEDNSLDCAILPEADANGLRAISGASETKDTYEVLISRNVADKILKNPTFNFINDYDDLIGMFCDTRIVDAKEVYQDLIKTDEEHENAPRYYYNDYYGLYYIYNPQTEAYEPSANPPEGVKKRKYLRIAGVVDSDELAVFLNEDMFRESALTLQMPDDRIARYYTHAAIYSDDVNKTMQFLKSNGFYAVANKESMQEELNDAKASMFGYLSTMAILIGVLCVCMYFIMRSIYMNRMKEIGTYRAIGVSKGNMMYRSFVETGVMTTLSAFLGYFLTTAFMVYLRTFSAKIEDVFYFPWWLALLVLILIYAICLFSGTLSVRTVLRRTPAEIMAKYDI